MSKILDGISHRTWRTSLVIVATLLTAACGGGGGSADNAEDAGGDDGDGSSASSVESSTEPGSDTPGRQFAAEHYTTDLTGVCPDPIVVQTGWFPEPARGHYFQMIGDGGDLNIERGTYSGPLGSTGVNLEIRFGGPFIGDQPTTSLMYQDDDILLGEVGTDEQIRLFEEFPTVAVVAPTEKSPQILLWDPEAHPDFETIDDIGKSGVPVLVFGIDDGWIRNLVNEGALQDGQLDDSFDGSYTRFLASGGEVVQQGYVIRDPFLLQDLEEYGRDVGYVLIADTGYENYENVVAIRPDELEDATPCLELLVPIIQQATIDYYFTNPEPVNLELARMVDDLASFWTLSPELNAYSVQVFQDEELASNGPDDTIGNFDLDRVNSLIELLEPIYVDVIPDFTPGAAADTIVTNQFIDPDIGL